MKKRTKIILIVISTIVLLGIIFGTVDYFRAGNDKAPIFAIRVANYRDGGSKEYWGLGYKVIKCNTLRGDKSVHFGFYNINVNRLCNNDPIDPTNEFVIIDETETCASVLEKFYEDDTYEYYFPCIKSSSVFIEFTDGRKYNLKFALTNNIISMKEIEEYSNQNPELNLFFKVPKNSNRYQFIGIIIEQSSDGILIIEPNEDEDIRNTATKISVNTFPDRMYKVGQKVIVTYIGAITETYPAQVNAIDVELYSPAPSPCLPCSG